MDAWRDRWRAIVASDVGTRDGLGWEFSPVAGGAECWTVFREDGGSLPVFAAARGVGPLPDEADLQAMTRTAVNDLLVAADLADDTGWGANNIAAALMFASDDIVSWEGVEWALESGPNDEAEVWSDVDAKRTPYAWLRARCVASDRVVDVYQDDANFGLRFLTGGEPLLPRSDVGSLRSRRDIPLVKDRVRRVDVVYNSTVDGSQGPGLLTEALLRGQHAGTLLVAAEAYSAREWHLYDESVVALADPSWADGLDWLPPRQPWPFSKGQL